MACTTSAGSEEVLSNVDLLSEILLHVPASSVIKLKLVSKQWLSVISNPKFAPRHIRLHAKSSSSGLYLSGEYWEEFKVLSLCSQTITPSLNYLNYVAIHWSGRESRISIKDSCNGLLLCYYEVSKRPRYFVCNPTTRKCTLLPLLPQADSSTKGPTCLAFDPSKSPFYKVVSVRGCRLEIYSSETASWKEIIRAPQIKLMSEHRVYWEGAVHWVKCNSHYKCDLDEAKLEEIHLLPEDQFAYGGMIRYFGVCGERLLLLVSDDKPYSKGIRILEIGKGCCSWTLRYRGHLGSSVLRWSDFAYCYNFSVVHVRDAEEDDMELLLYVYGRLWLYDIKSKAVNVLFDSETFTVHGFQYVESLAPVR